MTLQNCVSSLKQTPRKRPFLKLNRGAMSKAYLSVFGRYMVPANIYQALSLTSSKSTRLAFSHSGMIPWTAEFVAGVINESAEVSIDANDILEVSRANTRLVYGV